MCKFDLKNGDTRIDPCMRPFIQWLSNKHRVLACCCGHGKYYPSVVIREGAGHKLYNLEIFSQKIIPRKKRFYKRDEEGVYFIPEAMRLLSQAKDKMTAKRCLAFKGFSCKNPNCKNTECPLHNSIPFHQGGKNEL